jgi:manganese/zinc/iron transport system substrate-binding protein
MNNNNMNNIRMNNIRMNYIANHSVAKIASSLQPKKRTYSIYFTILLQMIFFGTVGIVMAENKGTDKTINAVTTTSIIADTVKALGKDLLEVKALMGSSVDPHLYKPTRSDIATLSNADIIFVNGLLLEGKFQDTFNRLEGGGKRLVRVGELIDPTLLRSPKEFNNHYDPHIWMDPVLWSEVAKVIKDKLIQILPEHSKNIENNLTEFLSTLAKLDDYARTTLNQLNHNQRKLVTAHDAFGYFGRRYNLEILSIQGISTESEAGIRQIETLVDRVVKDRIPAVFVESTISSRSIKAIVEGAKARGFNVQIGGELFSDGMGQESTYEGTYQGMIDHNITVIGHALSAKTPQKGLFGKLNSTK